jgi:PAS domain S-box-containing protein
MMPKPTDKATSESAVFFPREGAILRILLLEDLRSDADVIALELRKLVVPKEIKVVTNRADFETHFRQYQPHLVLSDYSLPQYTGLDALHYVRERNPYLPFIICTGSMNEEIAVQCLKSGADDYVLKDSLGRLCSAIENALSAKQNLVSKELATADLEASEENMRAIAQNAPDHIFKIRPDGTIIYANRMVSDLPIERIIGKSIYEFACPAEVHRLQASIAESHQQAVQTALEIRGHRRGGSDEWYLCRMGPVMAGGEVKAIVLIASNITSRIRAERETAQLNEQLQTLTKHLEQVREQEKEKIAVEIHDELGQELTGTKLSLFWIKQQLLSGNLAAQQGAILERIDDLIGLTSTTIETVRRIAHELRPVVLDNMGLEAALDWYTKNFSKNTGIDCSLHVDLPEITLSKRFSTSVYRIVQEALTNVARHSGAQKAWVDLILEDDTLLLQIRDNGKGIDVSKALKSNSLGIFGIRERIRGWDGTLDLVNQNPKGSLLRVQFQTDVLVNIEAMTNFKSTID